MSNISSTIITNNGQYRWMNISCCMLSLLKSVSSFEQEFFWDTLLFISIHAYFFLHYYNIKTDGIWLYFWDKMIAKEISFLESNCIYMSKIFFLLLVENADKISHIVIIVICIFVIFIITFWCHKRTKNLTCNKINILAFWFDQPQFVGKIKKSRTKIYMHKPWW